MGGYYIVTNFRFVVTHDLEYIYLFIYEIVVLLSAVVIDALVIVVVVIGFLNTYDTCFRKKTLSPF